MTESAKQYLENFGKKSVITCQKGTDYYAEILPVGWNRKNLFDALVRYARQKNRYNKDEEIIRIIAIRNFIKIFKVWGKVLCDDETEKKVLRKRRVGTYNNFIRQQTKNENEN